MHEYFIKLLLFCLAIYAFYRFDTNQSFTGHEATPVLMAPGTPGTEVTVPKSFSLVKPSESRSFEGTTSLDFQFPYSDGTEARKKGGGGGKMGKKMMMMMMMGLKAKLMMLGPLILGMAGLMAIKALIASVISLTISKIMIIKKLMKNKGAGGGHGGGGWDSSSGGGGGPWASGGGGGWDRRSIYERNQDNSWDASDLAYRAYSTVENLF
ncbi:hypothetical protein RUM43_013225 [Polyplax serrata]|uniref:Uncharacterized protein n=1 Tax=Polyplax serrata TaxID=468196 RepID=A0AAN8P2R8_POLSC